MKVGGGAVDLVGLYTLALLVNFCGFFWAGGIAMRFRTIQAAPLMQMPVFLVLFFAPCTCRSSCSRAGSRPSPRSTR